MRRIAVVLALLLFLPQVASSGVHIKAVKAYEYSKWEYFTVGIKNNGDSQNLTVKIRAYRIAGYESYKILGEYSILTEEGGSSHMKMPDFMQTDSEWWEAGAYKEVLLRWIVSPCNCKRFQEYPVVVVVEVFRNDSATPADSVTLYMESEYLYWTP